MGAACCKCVPRWENEDDVLCAYVYEERACCRPKKYILGGCRADDDDHEWNAAANTTVRKLIEEDVFNPYGQPVEIAADIPKACCGFEIYKAKMFEAAVARLEKEWSPKMNQKIEQYGYMVEGFWWVECRYIYDAVSGGEHTQQVPHFCIRVKKLPEKDE